MVREETLRFAQGDNVRQDAAPLRSRGSVRRPFASLKVATSGKTRPIYRFKAARASERDVDILEPECFKLSFDGRGADHHAT